MATRSTTVDQRRRNRIRIPEEPAAWYRSFSPALPYSSPDVSCPNRKPPNRKVLSMSHLSGRCTCGRVIHLPKGASHGTSWTCHNCGRTWYLSPRGNNPLHSRRSKAPPEHVPAPISHSGDGGGNDFDSTALVIGGIAALLIAPSLCLVGAGLVGGLWAYKHFD